MSLLAAFFSCPASPVSPSSFSFFSFFPVLDPVLDPDPGFGGLEDPGWNPISDSGDPGAWPPALRSGSNQGLAFHHFSGGRGEFASLQG